MKAISTLLLTPPSSQLNGAYPANAFLAGYLDSLGYPSYQYDLGLDLAWRLFSRPGLEQAFTASRLAGKQHAVMDQAMRYLQTVDAVMAFLAGANPTLAWGIVSANLLPQGPRFDTIQGADEVFGSMGISDKAKYYASLYLADLGDFVRACLSPHFGLSRYAEKLSRSPPSFDPILQALQEPDTLCEHFYLAQTERLISDYFGLNPALQSPGLVAITIPFPGNLFAALKIGHYIKTHWPKLTVVMGGGYVSTELRQMSDPRLFDYLDYLVFDDGYRPLVAILEALGQTQSQSQFQSKVDKVAFKRTLFRNRYGQVQYDDSDPVTDPRIAQTGTPRFAPAQAKLYLDLIDLANPMQRLWNAAGFNKILFAHGCYWQRCSFCDTALPYIADYDPAPARLIVDRMDAIAAETGSGGFHGVDEAAPPALLGRVALELLRRGRAYTWWTNIRYDRCFSPDLCRLLAAAGMVAVSGGIEVANPRLLDLIQKGVALPELMRTLDNFCQAGIMTHGYLMYGFPSQTEQETIDSLEIVRQIFKAGLLVSAFWHRLSVTAHSALGRAPASYGITIDRPGPFPFATNDLDYHEAGGFKHDSLGAGLHKAVFNYQHGIGLDAPVHTWFDTKVRRSTVAVDWLENCLVSTYTEGQYRRLLFIGQIPRLTCPPAEAAFIAELCRRAQPQAEVPLLIEDLKVLCQESTGMPIQVWLNNPRGRKLRKAGLLLLT